MLTRLLGLALLALAALFGLAFESRYWRWRDCFNELGRCYDPATQDVLLEQAGVIWGSLAVIALCAALILLLRARRRPGAPLSGPDRPR